MITLTQIYSFLHMFIMPPANDFRFAQTVDPLGSSSSFCFLEMSLDKNSLQIILNSSS